jgi:hypothetical protein
LWEQAEVINHEPQWKTRKFHKAAEILKDGDMVTSAPRFDIYAVWRPMIKNLKIGKKEDSRNRMAIGTVARKRIEDNGTAA